MSRNKYYQSLLNAKKWKELRQWKLNQNPLCELCQREGKVVSAVDVHHITPVETGQTQDEMKQLAYDPTNLQSLCIAHHIQVHAEAKSHTRESHERRERDRLEQWKDELERRVQELKQRSHEDGKCSG